MSLIHTYRQGGGVTDHGALTGLADDDHAQYILVGGSRGFTSTVSGTIPIEGYHLATKEYVDNAVISGGGVTDHGALTGLADDDHTQYLTTSRGDNRYYTESEVDTISGTLQSDINNRIISNPGSGEYKITNIRLDADLKMVITYNNVPEP
jgi:hypothetical protein